MGAGTSILRSSSIMILVNEIAASEAAMDGDEISPAAIAESLSRFEFCCWLRSRHFFAAEMWSRLAAREWCSYYSGQWQIRSLHGRVKLRFPCQVNGKLVNVVKVPAGSDDDAVKAAALADEKAKVRLEGKTVVKVIVVPGKLVNRCGEVVERLPEKQASREGFVIAAGTVRGTQSFVHTLSECWRRPSLTALEVLGGGRMGFQCCWFCGMRPFGFLRETPVDIAALRNRLCWIRWHLPRQLAKAMQVLVPAAFAGRAGGWLR